MNITVQRPEIPSKSTRFWWNMKGLISLRPLDGARRVLSIEGDSPELAELQNSYARLYGKLASDEGIYQLIEEARCTPLPAPAQERLASRVADCLDRMPRWADAAMGQAYDSDKPSKAAAMFLMINKFTSAEAQTPLAELVTDPFCIFVAVRGAELADESRAILAKNMAKRMMELKGIEKISNPMLQIGGQRAIDHEIGVILTGFGEFVANGGPKLMRFVVEVVDQIDPPVRGSEPYRNGASMQ
jgi:hypothetical protein